MVVWLKAFKQVLEGLESGAALVTGTVHGENGSRREYRSRKQLLDLAQNANTFHDRAKRDDFELVRSLLEPAIDHAVLAHARLAFELADVADAVVADRAPASVMRANCRCEPKRPATAGRPRTRSR